jgi:hypothetical protein
MADSLPQGNIHLNGFDAKNQHDLAMWWGNRTSNAVAAKQGKRRLRMEKAKEGQVHMRVGNRREHMTKRESNQVLRSQYLILVFNLNQSPSHSHAPPHERALLRTRGCQARLYGLELGHCTSRVEIDPVAGWCGRIKWVGPNW